MGDLTIIILAAMLIVLCVVVMKINEKIDRHINRFKRLEKALVKNATGKIPVPENPPSVARGDDVPMAATSSDLYSGKPIIARSKRD